MSIDPRRLYAILRERFGERVAADVLREASVHERREVEPTREQMAEAEMLVRRRVG